LLPTQTSCLIFVHSFLCFRHVPSHCTRNTNLTPLFSLLSSHTRPHDIQSLALHTSFLPIFPPFRFVRRAMPESSPRTLRRGTVASIINNLNTLEYQAGKVTETPRVRSYHTLTADHPAQKPVPDRPVSFQERPPQSPFHRRDSMGTPVHTPPPQASVEPVVVLLEAFVRVERFAVSERPLPLTRGLARAAWPGGRGVIGTGGDRHGS